MEIIDLETLWNFFATQIRHFPLTWFENCIKLSNWHKWPTHFTENKQSSDVQRVLSYHRPLWALALSHLCIYLELRFPLECGNRTRLLSKHLQCSIHVNFSTGNSNSKNLSKFTIENWTFEEIRNCQLLKNSIKICTPLLYCWITRTKQIVSV